MVIIFYLQLFVSLGFLIIFQFFPVYKRKICAFFFFGQITKILQIFFCWKQFFHSSSYASYYFLFSLDLIISRPLYH